MYLERKIDKWLLNWKKRDTKSPALVVGIRQCGKTKSIDHFAESYRNVVKINFWDHPDYCRDFDGSLDVETIISNLSLRFSQTRIIPHETLIFFDEIQECPRASLAFKNFELDGRYDVIGSGSYLGINGYNLGDATPVPIGYEDVFQMRTMDFEEFLWANGYKDEQISLLRRCFEHREEVPEPAHSVFKELFLKYACVGGFPKAVKAYLSHGKNVMEAVRVTKSTIFEMKGDFGRRQGKDGEPIFKAAEVARIQDVFDLIPTFLAQENKKFIVSKISSGSSQEKRDAVEYLQQAHIVNKVFNVSAPSLPLVGGAIRNQFKLFPEDISIVASMYGKQTYIAMNRGELGQNKGAIYEALAFDGLSKAGIEPFYFAKESGLEVDFVISYQGYPYLAEVKPKNGNAKSSKTIMKHPEHYGETKLLKIGDYQMGEEGDILTIPHYMMFLLGEDEDSL